MPSDDSLLRHEVAEHIPWITAVITSPDEPIEDLNGLFQRKFGAPVIPPEAVGVGPRVAGRSLRARIAQVLETGRPVRIHRCRMPHSNGEGGRAVRYVDIWLEPLQREGQSTGAVILYGVDVTHRVHAARALQRALEHEHKLLASLATKLWSADALGSEVRDIGDAPALLRRHNHKHTTERAESRTLADLFEGSEWQEAVRARRPYSRARREPAGTGTRYLVTHAIPVLDEAGEIAQWIGVDIDVSEHVHRLSAEIDRALPAGVMENRLRNMRAFSHDVRNALHAADGYAQLLETRVHGPLTDEQHEYLRRMRTIFHGALGLLTDLLNTERAIAGELELEHRPAELTSLVSDCVESHRAEATLKRLLMRVEDVPKPVWTRTDPARVRQILHNLISNALKFTTHGGITIRLKADGFRRTGDRRRWIAVSISDTGRGIPMESRDVIFEEFVRLAHADAGDGQGVGLATSRRLARLLGGEITVTSEEGEGSTFTLWLPRDWPDDGIT